MEGLSLEETDDDDDQAVEIGGNASRANYRRKRQVSTSLQSHPIKDDDLRDFHEHRLKQGLNPLDVRYNLYSMVVSGQIATTYFHRVTKKSNFLIRYYI